MHTSPTPSADSPLPVMSALMASLPAYPTASSSSPAAFPIYHTQTAAAASSASASSYSSPPAATHSASAPQGRRPSPPLHPQAAYTPSQASTSAASSSSSLPSSSVPAAEMYNPRYITHRLLDIERCLHHLTSVAYVHPITGQGLVSAFYAIKYAMQALGAEEKQLEARLRRRREAVKLEGVEEAAEEGEGLMSVLSRELSGPEDDSQRQREMREIRRKKKDLRHVGEFIHQQIAALYTQVQTQMRYHPVTQQPAAAASTAFTFASSSSPSSSSVPAASSSSFFSSSFASSTASAYMPSSASAAQSFPPPPLPELTGSLSSSSASSSSSPTCITPPPAAPPLPTFIVSPRPSSPPSASFLAFPPVDKSGEYTPLFDFSDPFSVSAFAPAASSASSSSSSSSAYFHRPPTQLYSSSSDSRDSALPSGWAADREEGRTGAAKTAGKRRTRGLSHGEGLSSLSAAHDAGGFGAEGGNDRMTEEDNDDEDEEREREAGGEREGGRGAQRRGRRGGGRRRKREDYAEVLYAYPRQHSAFPKLPSEADNPHELPEDRAANTHRPRMHRQMTE